MTFLHNAYHLLGTHSLVVSTFGQCFVLYQAVRAKDAGAIRQSATLILALILVVVSIELRPKSPPDTLADGLGVVAAVVFIVPVVEGFRKARQVREDKGR